MSDWREIIGTVAPGLAAAFGGPLAGTAVKAIADKVLGRPGASQAEVIEALSTASLTSDQIIALKSVEQQFQLELARINADTERAYLQDVKDARTRQVETKDLMPNYIFWLMAVLYSGSTLLLYFGPTPADDFTRSLLVKSYSIVEVGFTAALFFFVGSSNGSKRAGDAVRKIAANQSSRDGY